MIPAALQVTGPDLGPFSISTARLSPSVPGIAISGKTLLRLEKMLGCKNIMRYNPPTW